MNTRRILCTLLGVWMGVSLFAAALAAFSFRLVNQMIVNPPAEFAPYIKAVGLDKLRLLARYQASEFNRAMFEGWGLAQILIGLLVFGIILFGTKEGKLVLAISLVMLALVTGMHLLVTPSIVGYGRSLDFVAPDKDLQARKELQAIHNMYSALEGMKLLGGVVLLGIFYRDGRRRGMRDDANEPA